MKTIAASQSGEILEAAKNIFYSIQVIGIGLFIPFIFLFGITYHAPQTSETKTEVRESQANPTNWGRTTVEYVNYLPDQNS